MKEVATSMIGPCCWSGRTHRRSLASRNIPPAAGSRASGTREALAARGDSGVEPQFLPGPKPWERPEYLRGEVRKVKREALRRLR